MRILPMIESLTRAIIAPAIMPIIIPISMPIIIGIIGYGIDILMRKAENRLIPWKGKG